MKQPPRVFYKKGVLKIFAKLIVKHMCQSLFFLNEVAGVRRRSSADLLNADVLNVLFFTIIGLMKSNRLYGDIFTNPNNFCFYFLVI